MDKKINIHSVTDVITNSSTELFISANENSVQPLKDLINQLLFFVNADKTADDLFEFKVIRKTVGSYGEDGTIGQIILKPKIKPYQSVLEINLNELLDKIFILESIEV